MVSTRSAKYTAATAVSCPTRRAACHVIRSPQQGGSDLRFVSKPSSIRGVVTFLDTQYSDLIDKYGVDLPRAWLKKNAVIDGDSFKNFVKSFNKAVETHKNKRVSERLQLKSIKKWADPTLSLAMEQDIFDTVKELSVEDPKKLEKQGYKPFSSEVYGETTPVQMRSILDEINVGPDDIFIDLGSGIGQFPCFAAAHAKVKMAYGIELADKPADIAVKYESWFKKVMKFLGRTHTKTRLIHGSITDLLYRDLICQKATILYVNNFCFDPSLKQEVKKMIAECKNGMKIVSSAPLVLPNTRKSKFQTSKDILAPISTSRLLTGVKNGVSWKAAEAELTMTTIHR